MLNPEQHKEGTGEADGEPGNIDYGNSSFFKKDSECLFELVESHRGLVFKKDEATFTLLHVQKIKFENILKTLLL
jgi:hypothetical protein